MGGRAPGLRSEGSWLAAELLRAGLEPGVLDRCAGWLGLSPAHAQGAPLASKGPACLSPPLGRVRYVLVSCAEGTGATIQPFRFCPLISLPARPMPEALLSREPRGAPRGRVVCPCFTPLPFSVELDAYGASLTCHVPPTYHEGSGWYVWTRQARPLLARVRPRPPRMRRGARTHNNTARPARQLGPSFAP